MKEKIAEWINVIFGYRKFLLMLLIAAIAIIFRVKDLINGSEMVDLIKSVGIAFMSANGIEHIVGAYNTRTTANSSINQSGPAVSDEKEVEDVK